NQTHFADSGEASRTKLKLVNEIQSARRIGHSCQPTKKNSAGIRYGQVRANRDVASQTVRSRAGGRTAAAELATARPPHLRTEHELRRTRLLLLLLLHFGKDQVARLCERLLRVLLVALQVLLPGGLADHELLEPERVRADRLARRELLPDGEGPVGHPRRRALLPLRPHRLVGRELAG